MGVGLENVHDGVRHSEVRIIGHDCKSQVLTRIHEISGRLVDFVVRWRTIPRRYRGWNGPVEVGVAGKKVINLNFGTDDAGSGWNQPGERRLTYGHGLPEDRKVVGGLRFNLPRAGPAGE